MPMLTAIWQHRDLLERDWINEIFSPHISRHIYDGRHEVVLDNCLLIDSYVHAFPSDYYRRFRGRKAWLMHMSDETYEGGYDVYGSFCGVFRNYEASIFNRSRVLAFPVGYRNYDYASYPLRKASERPWLWSFLGDGRKASRPEMLKAVVNVKPHFLYDTGGASPLPSLSLHQCQEVLRDSAFAPCPMGNTVLETTRVYEALECGAIPILERRATLDYFRRLFGEHPLPAVRNWREGARLISAMAQDQDRLNSLQNMCLDWWRTYKSRLSTEVGNFLMTERPVGQPPVSWKYSLPGWQVIELTRHHTLPAFARRCRVQIDRLVSQGKLRKTYGR